MPSHGATAGPVTIVAHDAGGIGGMERQLEELIVRQADAGREVVVIARRCEVPPHPRVRVVRVRAPARPFALAYPWFLIRASFLLRRNRRGLVHATGAIVLNRVDIITAHLCHCAYLEQGTVRRSRRPAAHYRLNAAIAGWMSRTAERWCYRPGRVRRLVGVSPGVSRELARHFPRVADRVDTVRNGVDADRFCPPTDAERLAARELLGARDDDELVALFVGSEWEGKGLRIAVEAVAACPRWTLVVVGAGDRSRYARIARSLGVNGRIRFLEPRSDIVPVYQGCDAFVLPSAYETFSLVSHEAAACALPLLVTRVSGVDELVLPEVNGWFVERKAGDVARRLTALEHDRQLRTRMGAAAREAVLPLSWEAMGDGYARLYATLEEQRA